MTINYKNPGISGPSCRSLPISFDFDIGRPDDANLARSVDFARRCFAPDKVARSEASRPERLVNNLHQLDHALFVPLPSDHLHADRQPRHVLRVIDPSRTVHALFKDLAPVVSAPALVPFVREAVPRRVDKRDGDLADGRIDYVPLDRACTSRRKFLVSGFSRASCCVRVSRLTHDQRAILLRFAVFQSRRRLSRANDRIERVFLPELQTSACVNKKDS